MRRQPEVVNYLLDYDEGQGGIICWSSLQIQMDLQTVPGARWGAVPKLQPGPQPVCWTILPTNVVNFLSAEALAPVTETTEAYRRQREITIQPSPELMAGAEWLAQNIDRPMLPHQAEFVATAWPLNSIYNASEQGTGKTGGAWGISRLWNAQRVLILCPKSVARQWPAEGDCVLGTGVYSYLVLDEGSSVRRAEKVAQLQPRHAGAVGTAIIVNYEALYAMVDVLIAWNPDLLVADEVWRLKNPKARVTRSAMALVAATRPRVLPLSGTPIGQHVGDLFSQLKLMNMDLPFDTQDEFMGRFARYVPIDLGNGKTTLKAQGCVDPAGLIRLLMSMGWYRATKSTCLQLPPKHFERITIPLSEEQRALYKRVTEEGEAVFDPLSLMGQRATVLRQQQVVGGFVPRIVERGLVAFDPALLEDDMVDADGPLIAEPIETVEAAVSRRQLEYAGSTKMDWLKSWAEDNLANDPSVRVIVWCRFNPEVAYIETMLQEVLGEHRVRKIWGNTKQGDITDIKDSFNSRDVNGVQVIVAQIKKLAYGHNLQSCDINVIYSPTWSYIEWAQLQDRSHRMGREGGVSYLLLCSPRTVDERIYDALDRHEELNLRLAPDTVSVPVDARQALLARDPI